MSASKIGLGREATSAVASDVVARDEAPRSAVAIEEPELRTTPAPAGHVRVRLTRSTQVISPPVFARVLPPGDDLKILRPVVGLVAVPVVDDLAPPERPVEHLRRNEAVLVDVAAHVCHRVAPSLDEDVSIRRDGTAAFPVRASLTSRPIDHKQSVANGRDVA